MRVTHVITRLIVGGAQENTVSSVLGLSRLPDIQIKLISGPGIGPEGSMESCFDSGAGILEILPELVRPVSPWKDLVALRKLTHLMRAHPPQIVHTHSGKAGIVGRLAASKAGVPVIIHTIHGPSFGPFQGKVANVVFTGAERVAAKVTTHFVTVADAMRDQYLAKGIGTPAQYTRILSGFDLQPFLNAENSRELRARTGIPEKAFVIGKLARLTHLKGHEELVEAAPEIVRRCPEAVFLFIGGGDLRSKIEERIKALGIADKFFFTGLLLPGQVAPYIGMMDMLVHLSRREGLARALPQALAAGKPVVAYNCDGAKEVCLEGQTGFLVSPGDLSGLVSRICEIAQNPELKLRLGRAGRAFVAERFSVERMVSDLHELYVRLSTR